MRSNQTSQNIVVLIEPCLNTIKGTNDKESRNRRVDIKAILGREQRPYWRNNVTQESIIVRTATFFRIRNVTIVVKHDK